MAVIPGFIKDEVVVVGCASAPRAGGSPSIVAGVGAGAGVVGIRVQALEGLGLRPDPFALAPERPHRLGDPRRRKRSRRCKRPPSP